MPKLYAISDLHISYKFNLEAFQLLKPHPEDSLILAGDVGEKLEHLHEAFRLSTHLFKQVFWVPGNHELYTLPHATDMATEENVMSPASGVAPEPDDLKGQLKYLECVRVANEYGVITPEDEYLTWEDGEGVRALICPLFTLYDYSFRPDHVTKDKALDWAMEHNIRATDEALLHSDPFETKEAWCDELISKTAERLQAAVSGKDETTKVVLINHWPLREDLINIPLVPRFSLWCGSKRTEDWHERFKADVVVTGHLHVRRTDWIGDCRFEEVSLGYPRQWEGARQRGKGVNELLREILPGPEKTSGNSTLYRRYG